MILMSTKAYYYAYTFAYRKEARAFVLQMKGATA